MASTTVGYRPCRGYIWYDGQCQARPRGCRPIGVALLITAGKRSAPADRNPTPLRPHGGRTSFRRRAGAWKRGTGPWRVTAPRCPRVCLWRSRGNGKLDPYGVPLLVGSFRGFAFGSPAVIKGSTPMGSPASRCGFGVRWVFPAAGLGVSSRALDPYGVPLLVGSFPRVRLWLTRGYQRFDPIGVACLAVWLWGAEGSPCGRPRCIFAGVGPLWGPHIYALSVRGRAELTRGYRVVRPL